jgi:hypothetical protein
MRLPAVGRSPLVPPGWPRLAAWIGEVLDEPHTRELLETILAAVWRAPGICSRK